MMNVFISYASEDRERARKLASALEACGWSVWWDRKIKAGQTFDQVIEHELETAKSVVVLWSKDSIRSEWVKNEAAAAADRRVLVPALIDNIKLPLEFRRRQAADLTGWDGDPSHAGFQALCEGIEGIAGIPAAAALGDSTTQRKASLSWNQRIVSSIAAIAVVLALGAYIGLRLFLPQEIERSQENSISAPLEREKRSEESKALSSSSKAKATADRQPLLFTKAGMFEFKWPGPDCWAIYRGEEKVTSTCGSGKQALQAGTYVVKPSSAAVFVPFSATVKPDSVTSADAMGGIFEFKWPGPDCWAIYRGEEKVTSSCGSGKQALQAGTYVVKPSSSVVFVPFSVTVKPDSVTSADAMGGIFEFKWPGPDCWAIYREEEKVTSTCGSGKQALQAGTYVVKPSSSAVFKPFEVQVAKGQTATVP